MERMRSRANRLNGNMSRHAVKRKEKVSSVCSMPPSVYNKAMYVYLLIGAEKFSRRIP